jgi:hypothetical protein
MEMLIIDEVSMVRCDLLDVIDRLLFRAGNIGKNKVYGSDLPGKII